MSCIRFDVPISAPSLTNAREHFGQRASRVDRQRGATRRRWPGYEGGPLVVVRLTRVAPRKLDDDNVRGALKSVRDEVAALLRVDDATPLVRWEYAQAKGAEDCVRVSVSWGTAPAALVGQVMHQLATQAEAAVTAAETQASIPGPVEEELLLPVVEVDASGPVRLVREPGRGERRAPRPGGAKSLAELATSASYTSKGNP